MPVSKTELDAALAHADMHMCESLDRLRELVAIKSISTDPAYANECRRAADWLVTELSGLGFAAAARPTPTAPPSARNPRRDPIKVTANPKLADFTRPYSASNV